MAVLFYNDLFFQVREDIFSAIKRQAFQFFFNAQQLIILRDAINPRGRAGFDLAGIHRDGEISNQRIVRFARTV